MLTLLKPGGIAVTNTPNPETILLLVTIPLKSSVKTVFNTRFTNLTHTLDSNATSSRIVDRKSLHGG